jgi:L-lactate dehydrogenase (cytochrome)
MDVKVKRKPNCFPVNAAAYRQLARKRVPLKYFDYLDGGAFKELTILENNRAYDGIRLRKRVFRDAEMSETETILLGEKLAQPVILAPIGFAGIYARRGEVQAAQAAELAGVPFCLSTLSICSLEEVRQSVSQPFWFQLYMMKDKGYCLDLLNRAQHAGCRVLVFTVDLPVLGVRYRDIRNNMFGTDASRMPIRSRLSLLREYLFHPHWLHQVYMLGQPLTLGNLASLSMDLQSLSQYRVTLSWSDLEWVREHWNGKLVVKGVLDQDDACQIADRGADGIIISNHAGRHLDSQPATVTLLPGIADALHGRMEIIIDGGIFNGLDVLKALALGADACMIGRAWAYALAASGKAGVAHVLAMLRTELKVAMAQLGVENVNQIDRSLIADSEIFNSST